MRRPAALGRVARTLPVFLSLLWSAAAWGQEPVPRPDTTRRAPRPTTDTLAPRRTAPDSLRIPVPVPPDTIPLDSAERARLLKAAEPTVSADTMRAPLGRPPMPPSLAIGERYRWTRDELYAAGAYTLAELLERIPGVTTFRTGWITTPAYAAYVGNARIRLYYDGIEMDPLDDRTGGVPDLVEVPLWTLEELVIERAAGELRVHMTSWRVDRTNASTRTDIATGDEDTNIYRGFFGRRYSHGEALQLAAQQYSTESARSTAGGDQLSLLGRIGWAARGFHADAYLVRTSRNRYAQETFLGDSTLSSLDATRTDAYVRTGYGDPARGLWLQLIASSQHFEGSGGIRPFSTLLDQEEADALRGTAVLRIAPQRSRTQYVAMAGAARWGLRLDLTARYRVFERQHLLAPSARLSMDRNWLTFIVNAERRLSDSVEAVRYRGRFADTTRTTDLVDGAIMVRPLSWVALGAAGGVQRGSGGTLPDETVRFARAEGAIRIFDLWVGGGVLMRDSLVVAPPLAINSRFTPHPDGEARGAFALLRGRIWKDIYADVQGTAWENDSSRYRPRYHARGEIFLRSEWRRRFPSGNFGILMAVREDYRSRVRFPLPDGEHVTADQSQVWSTRLEVRIVNAVIFWHYLNVLGERYQLVPNFQMPGQINLYGVRWQFWS